MKSKAIYVNSKELELHWGRWLKRPNAHDWTQMCEMIYKMCSGVAANFHPRTPDEFQEHVHDAFSQCMEKIKKRKLKYIAGKAPVFNLVTTTIIRILYSKCNKVNRRKENLKSQKYQMHFRQFHPELLAELEANQASSHAKQTSLLDS